MILIWHKLRSLIPHSFKRKARKLVWARLNPSWTLPSGILVRVLSYSDWIIYNDIFVDGEYDRAIHPLIEAPVEAIRPRRVLDLGANVGFFALRVADSFFRKGNKDFEIIAIEGSPANHRELGERLAANQNLLGNRVRVLNGLLGHRTGFGEISEGESCGENTIFSRSGPTARVPFVNLDEMVKVWATVDLLKCDIEGAEEMFLENYPELLRKTDRAVFEFHHDKCSVARCREILAESGLSKELTVREFGRCSVELFQRRS